MKNLFCNRLKNARLMKGLSMEELSHSIQGVVSKQAISKYENGQMMPSSQVLDAIAKSLNLPTDYFFRQGIQIEQISFRRNGEHIPVRAERQMILVAQDKMERYLHLEDLLAKDFIFKNPLKNRKISTMDDVEIAAQQLRVKWGAGNYPILSVYEMMESVGVKIIEFEAGAGCALGFSTFVNKTIPLIVVNLSNNHTSERKRFTALHELSHLLLKFEKSVTDKERERLCHRFAGAFLCPASVFQEELGHHRTAFTLGELVSLRCRYGISIAAIVHRAKDLGVITDTYYNHIYDTHIHANPMEEGWGAYPIMEHTDRYARLLQRALAEQVITEGEVQDLGEGEVYDSERVKVL